MLSIIFMLASQLAFTTSDSCKSIRESNIKKSVKVVMVPSGFEGNLADFEEVAKASVKNLEGYPPFSDQVPQIEFMMSLNEGNPNSFCSLGCEDIDRLLCCDQTQAYDLADSCTSESKRRKVVVIHNTSTYGGGATTRLAGITRHELSADILAHELGHSLFRLSDEYESTLENLSNYNCGNETCEEWADLIGSNNVGCEEMGCFHMGNRISETTIMQYLGYPFEEVNERVSCCAYKNLTGSYPKSYCEKYNHIGIGLKSYCRNKTFGSTLIYPRVSKLIFQMTDRGFDLVRIDRLKDLDFDMDTYQQDIHPLFSHPDRLTVKLEADGLKFETSVPRFENYEYPENLAEIASLKIAKKTIDIYIPRTEDDSELNKDQIQFTIE